MVRTHGMWLKLKGSDIPDADFNPIELKIGTEIEMEHTDNSEVAKAIAKLHLSENDLYYEYLIPMEIELENAAVRPRAGNEKKYLSPMEFELENRKRIKDVFGW